MNFRIFIPLSFILLSFWLKAAAQTNTNGNCLKTFQNKYHNNDDNTALSIVDAGNGQFYVAGNSVSSGSSDILITKHSADGSILWAKKYGAAGDETVRRIKLANDGGLLIIGQTKSFTNSNGDILCLKISATGQLIWSRKFGIGSTYGDLGMDIIQASDNNYVFTGILNVTGTLADMIVVKLDPNANILWSQRFDSNQGENGVGLLQKSDTLIVTSDIDNNTSDFNGLISKIRLSDGKLITTKKIRPDVRNLFNSYVYADHADGYWISGHTIDANSYAKMQQTLLHFDVNFKLIQSYKLDLSNNVYANDFYTGFIVKPDGFVTCASTTSNPAGYFFYIKNDGAIKLAKKFTGSTDRRLYSLLNVNGKYIGVGKENSSGKNNLLVTSFGEDGFVDEECHPDTVLLTVSKPSYAITDLSWNTINNQSFPDIAAPLTITDVSLTSSSLCDACKELDCNNWLNLTQLASGVQIGDLDMTGDKITVEAAFNRTTTYDNVTISEGDIVSKHRDFNDVNYLLRPNRAEITTSNGYFAAVADCNAEINKTYHVALVYDGSKLKFYRNGFLMKEVAASGNLTTNDYTTIIGDLAWQPGYNNETLFGYINNVRIWNTSRTQAQIKQYMNQPLPNPTTQAGLVAYYTFDNLKNKQGNATWDGTLLGNAVINATNPTCPTFVADSCPVVVPVDTVTVSFTAPDTVCVNSPVKITNTTKGGTNYYWNFCEPDINSNPTAVNIGNPGGYLSQPVFSDLAEYNGNYYAFVVNYQPGGLLRLDFGNSYLNTPTPVFLGNVGGIMNSNYGSEGIQVVKNNGRWYAIIVGGSPINAGSIPKLLKIDFGSDLTNTNPVATDWGNVGDLLQSIDLYLFQENSKWYGFAANSENNTLTRFDFSSSFNNTPIGTNLGNVSGVLNYPTGICAIKDNGNWYVFVGNGLDNSIVRLDFGNSLLNTPVAKNIGNPGNLLYQPRDITILKYCGSIIGFVVDTQNNLTRLDFNNDITSIPVAVSLGNIGDFDFSHSLSKIFRAGPDLYSFVTNVSNNTITRIRFPGCTNSSVPNSSVQNPPDVIYNRPGIYNINLSVDDGLPTQASYCKQVVVLPSPEKKPVLDTSFCKGDSIVLKAESAIGAYTWNTGSSKSSIIVKDANTYWVDINYYGCKVRDSIVTTFKVAPYVFLGNDTAICNHDSLMLDAGNSDLTYLWQDGSSLKDLLVKQTGWYSVKVTNADGCSSRDSIRIDSLESPRIFMKDTTICIGNTIMLNAQSTGNNNYQWQVSPTLSAVNIPNPVATPLDTSTYFVIVSNANNCKTKDSITVAVVPKPTVNAMADTSFCYGSTFTLSVTGTNTNHYGWSPSQGLSDVTLQNPSGTLVTNTIIYTVTAYNDGCSVSDNVKLTALPLPTLALTYKDTTICVGGQAQLNASGIGTFVWSPAIAINDTTSATPIVNPVTPTWYQVKITSANTCINNDSVFVAVNPKPVFAINPKQPSICIGDSVLITASGGDVYTWVPVTSVKNPYGASSVVYPSENTMYEVTITNNTCHVTESVFANVTVTTKPEITITKSNDIDCFIGSAKLEATGGSKFLWSPSAALSNTYGYTTIARPTETTTYYVEVTKNGSCKATDSIQVKVIKDGAQNGYLVPTAFTPNGDMRNDCFGVKNWGVVTNFDFSVYNRWGERIFYTRNASDCWNGMFKNTLQPPGAYVYQIRAKTLCGDVYRKGTIVLIR